MKSGGRYAPNNRAAVVSKVEEKEVSFTTIVFLLSCGHRVRRVVLDRRGYAPKRLWCEGCSDGWMRANGRRPAHRPRTAVLPPRKATGPWKVPVPRYSAAGRVARFFKKMRP